MVQVDDPLEGLFGRLGPGQDRFAPGHPQIVMEFSVANQTLLASVPERILGLSASECFPGIQSLSSIVLMLAQRFDGPGWNRLDRMVVASIKTISISEFSPDEKLIEVLLSLALVGFAGQSHRRYHAIMQVRRHATRVLGTRVIPLRCVLGNPILQKIVPALVPGPTPTASVGNRRDHGVDVALRYDLIRFDRRAIQGLKGQLAIVALRNAIESRPRSRESLFVELGRRIAERKRPIMPTADELHRHHASRIDGQDRQTLQVRQSLEPSIGGLTWEIVGDQQIGLLGQSQKTKCIL